MVTVVVQNLYNRTMDIHRPETVAAGSPNIGLLPYSGMGQGAGTGTFGETIIQTGVPCSIQAQGMGKTRGLGLLPGDAAGPAQWHIYTPPGYLAKGTVKDRDILVDDEGYRYQVSQASFSQLGDKLVCTRLEA